MNKHNIQEKPVDNPDYNSLMESLPQTNNAADDEV